MPLRVHCRCGQEVIVRYSEWVHVVLGLAILATIANVIVAIILFRDVRRLESEVEERVARVIEARESDALAKNAAGEERRAPTEASGAVRSGDDGSGGDAAKRAQPPSQGPTLAGSNEAAERTPLESSAPRPNGGGAARSRTGPPKSDAEGVAANVETEKERAENDPTPAER
ncbi:MAG TPA: hypothetical protein VK116_08975, partial [Planctomycetota bacterium]|nr:hypothetical protein [Planctomycetota bacterium]